MQQVETTISSYPCIFPVPKSLYSPVPNGLLFRCLAVRHFLIGRVLISTRTWLQTSASKRSGSTWWMS
jgi:hypothetical protein